MNPEETTEELSPEDAKASLGLATRLSEQFMMLQAEQDGTLPVEAPQEPQNAPQEDKTLRDEVLPDEENDEQLDGKTDEILEEISSLKDQIKDALEEPEEPEENKGFDEFKGEIKETIKSEISDLSKTIKDAIK